MVPFLSSPALRLFLLVNIISVLVFLMVLLHFGGELNQRFVSIWNRVGGCALANWRLLCGAVTAVQEKCSGSAQSEGQLNTTRSLRSRRSNGS